MQTVTLRPPSPTPFGNKRSHLTNTTTTTTTTTTTANTTTTTAAAAANNNNNNNNNNKGKVITVLVFIFKHCAMKVDGRVEL
jgi:hypothetical protein